MTGTPPPTPAAVCPDDSCPRRDFCRHYHRHHPADAPILAWSPRLPNGECAMYDVHPQRLHV